MAGPVPREIRVVYRKYDGALHWHFRSRHLGSDRYGTWLGLPAGHSIRRGEEPPVTVAHASVGLVPPDAGWMAWFNAAPDAVEVYCDVTTVPVWPTPDEVTAVDLDLDVIRFRAGRAIRVVDEDEFLDHQVRYGYPADLIAQARRTADVLHAALGDGTEPFAGGYHTWLGRIG